MLEYIVASECNGKSGAFTEGVIERVLLLMTKDDIAIHIKHNNGDSYRCIDFDQQ